MLTWHHFKYKLHTLCNALLNLKNYEILKLKLEVQNFVFAGELQTVTVANMAIVKYCNNLSLSSCVSDWI